MALGDALAKKVKGMKASYNQPSGDSAAVAEKMRNISEYRQATSPVIAPTRSAPVGPTKPNPKTQYGTRPGEKRIDTTGMTKPLGSFHKGGKVKKTGAYNLKKGEQVLTPAQQKQRSISVLGGAQAKSPAAGDSPDDMHIQKLDDGTFHITHSHTKGKEPMPTSKKFSAKNVKHLVKHVRAAYNAPAEPDMDDAQ